MILDVLVCLHGWWYHGAPCAFSVRGSGMGASADGSRPRHPRRSAVQGQRLPPLCVSGEPERRSPPLGSPANSGLLRQRLIEHIHLEQKFELGVVRLINLILSFVFLTCALGIAGKAEQCRSINASISDIYDLESLSDITSIDEIRDLLKDFSAKSGSLAPMSHAYFGEGAECVCVSIFDDISAIFMIFHFFDDLFNYF